MNSHEDTIATIITGAIFLLIAGIVVIIFMWLHQTWTYEAKITGDFKITAENNYEAYQYHTYSTSSCDGYDSDNDCISYTTTWHSYWSWDFQYTLQNTELDREVDTLPCTQNAPVNEDHHWTACEVNKYIMVFYVNTEGDKKKAWCLRNQADWKWIEVNSIMNITENRLIEVSCK